MLRRHSRKTKSLPKSPLIARAGDTGFIVVKANSFGSLSPKQQLAYWLTQASIAVDPIIYDQFSSFGLRQKRLLEEIVAHSGQMEPKTREKIADYAQAFLGEPRQP